MQTLGPWPRSLSTRSLAICLVSKCACGYGKHQIRRTACLVEMLLSQMWQVRSVETDKRAHDHRASQGGASQATSLPGLPAPFYPPLWASSYRWEMILNDPPPGVRTRRPHPSYRSGGWAVWRSPRSGEKSECGDPPCSVGWKQGLRDPFHTISLLQPEIYKSACLSTSTRASLDTLSFSQDPPGAALHCDVFPRLVLLGVTS